MPEQQPTGPLLQVSIYETIRQHLPTNQWRMAFEDQYFHDTKLIDVVADPERVQNDLVCIPGISNVTAVKICAALRAGLNQARLVYTDPAIQQKINETQTTLEGTGSTISAPAIFMRRPQRALLSQVAEEILGVAGSQPVTVVSKRLPDVIKTQRVMELEYGITVSYETHRTQLHVFLTKAIQNRERVTLLLDLDELVALSTGYGLYANLSQDDKIDQTNRLWRLAAAELPSFDIRATSFGQYRVTSGIIVHGKEAYIEAPGGVLRWARGLMLDHLEQLYSATIRESRSLQDVLPDIFEL